MYFFQANLCLIKELKRHKSDKNHKTA